MAFLHCFTFFANFWLSYQLLLLHSHLAYQQVNEQYQQTSFTIDPWAKKAQQDALKDFEWQFRYRHDTNGFIFDKDKDSFNFSMTLTTTITCSNSDNNSENSDSANSSSLTHSRPHEDYDLNLSAFYYTTFSDLCRLVDNQLELWFDKDFNDAYELSMDRDTSDSSPPAFYSADPDFPECSFQVPSHGSKHHR